MLGGQGSGVRGQGAIIGQRVIPHGARQAPANGARVGWLCSFPPRPHGIEDVGLRPGRWSSSRDAPPPAWSAPRHRLRVGAAVRPVPAVLPVADGAPHHRAPGRSAGFVRPCAVSGSQCSGAGGSVTLAPRRGRLRASERCRGRLEQVQSHGLGSHGAGSYAWHPEQPPLWETRRERDLRPCAVAMPRVVVDLAEPAYIERSS